MEDDFETIKIQWSGKTKNKVKCLNLDFDSEKSDHIYAALSRQKTNVVIESYEEARALAFEMSNYETEGTQDGRTWMNGPAAKACGRVKTEIIEAMRERGYEATYTSYGYFKDFVETENESDEIQPGDTVTHERTGETWTVTEVEDGFVRTEDGGAVASNCLE